MKRLMQRFMAKVEKTESCWIWKGCRVLGQGYGVIRVGGITERAHRVSYRLFNGPIGPGQYVCHKCDNPPCVNPQHLFLGSALDNARDKVSKGRGHNGEVDRVLHGEIMKSVWASYTPEQRAARVQSVTDALKGKPFTEEHLTNLRTAHAARRQPTKPKSPKPIRLVGYGTGKRDPDRPHGNLGRKKSAEHRAKLSAARKALWEAGAYENRKPRITITN